MQRVKIIMLMLQERFNVLIFFGLMFNAERDHKEIIQCFKHVKKMKESFKNKNQVRILNLIKYASHLL